MTERTTMTPEEKRQQEVAAMSWEEQLREAYKQIEMTLWMLDEDEGFPLGVLAEALIHQFLKLALWEVGPQDTAAYLHKVADLASEQPARKEGDRHPLRIDQPAGHARRDAAAPNG